jgi:hypothetical protein
MSRPPAPAARGRLHIEVDRRVPRNFAIQIWVLKTARRQQGRSSQMLTFWSFRLAAEGQQVLAILTVSDGKPLEGAPLAPSAGP